jgi:predicted transcriptional regulator
MSTKRRRNKTNPPRVSIGLPPAHLEQVAQIAEAHERSVAWVVRYAVRLFLEEVEKGQLSLDLEPDSKER